MKRLRLLALVLFFAAMTLATAFTAHAELVEGRDYTVLRNPQPTHSDNNVEVIEFFWYGCPHCYQLHPYISAWLKRKPKDVSFRYVPAIFRPSWIPAARIFYALEVLGARDKLHDKVYDAIHVEKIDLNKEDVLFDWVAKQGIDRQKFIDAYNSFSVQNQDIPRSTNMSKSYGLTGVPAVVVDGKYMTSGRMGGTPEDTVRITEELIEKARAERLKK
jgi:protein dithiol oxidoreductase (disulfide-forming)